MCSFQKARDGLLAAYDTSLIDDDEFMLLYDACRSKKSKVNTIKIPPNCDASGYKSLLRMSQSRVVIRMWL